MTSLDAGIARLRENTAQFVRTLEMLPPGAFLQKIDEWSPRDIFAHLIGWTELIRKGCKQIQAGKLPSYYEDPGDDYSKINARLVQQYDSQDLTTLLGQHEAAQRELISYLRSLDPGNWSRDFGVEYRGEKETIGDSVIAFAEDYEHHRAQIEAWSRARED